MKTCVSASAPLQWLKRQHLTEEAKCGKLFGALLFSIFSICRTNIDGWKTALDLYRPLLVLLTLLHHSIQSTMCFHQYWWCNWQSCTRDMVAWWNFVSSSNRRRNTDILGILRFRRFFFMSASPLHRCAMVSSIHILVHYKENHNVRTSPIRLNVTYSFSRYGNISILKIQRTSNTTVHNASPVASICHFIAPTPHCSLDTTFN